MAYLSLKCALECLTLAKFRSADRKHGADPFALLAIDLKIELPSTG